MEKTRLIASHRATETTTKRVPLSIRKPGPMLLRASMLTLLCRTMRAIALTKAMRQSLTLVFSDAHPVLCSRYRENLEVSKQ
jgi:hypothetical protein